MFEHVERKLQSMLTSLPPEALRNILSHCDPKTLENVSLVCSIKLHNQHNEQHDHLLWLCTELPPAEGPGERPAAVARHVPCAVAVCEHRPLQELADVLHRAHKDPARVGHGQARRLPRVDVPRPHRLHHRLPALPRHPHHRRLRPHRACLARKPVGRQVRHSWLPLPPLPPLPPPF